MCHLPNQTIHQRNLQGQALDVQTTGVGLACLYEREPIIDRDGAFQPITESLGSGTNEEYAVSNRAGRCVPLFFLSK